MKVILCFFVLPNKVVLVKDNAILMIHNKRK